MRKLLPILMAVFISTSLNAQIVTTFETFSLSQPDTFYVNYNNPNTDVGFDFSSVHFQCVYDTSYGGIWSSGFAFSNMTDSVTSGYTNQYAAKAGQGFGGSSNYAAYFAGYGGGNRIVLNGNSVIKKCQGFYITNSTYAYNSMRDGDAFAKKFGGATGNDPDWFKLTVKGYANGLLTTDSVDFYLADFRDADNTKDSILKDWRWVNLSSLGSVDSLEFSLSSSDVGNFGMNTPAYFCMDNFTVDYLPLGVAEQSAAATVKIYPNPASSQLMVEAGHDGEVKGITIMDLSGKVVAAYVATEAKTVISTAALASGQYILRLSNGRQVAVQRFQKD